MAVATSVAASVAASAASWASACKVALAVSLAAAAAAASAEAALAAAAAFRSSVFVRGPRNLELCIFSTKVPLDGPMLSLTETTVAAADGSTARVLSLGASLRMDSVRACCLGSAPEPIDLSRVVLVIPIFALIYPLYGKTQRLHRQLSSRIFY